MSKTQNNYQRSQAATLATGSANSETQRGIKTHKTLLIGEDGIALEDFLAQPVAHWVGD